MSFLSQKEHSEHQRNGYLQVRGMRKSNRKKLLKKKDSERNLHFASFPPEVQAALRERRDVSNGKKWTSFNASVVLTDEEVRQLTEASCEIYPLQGGYGQKRTFSMGQTFFLFPQSIKIDGSILGHWKNSFSVEPTALTHFHSEHHQKKHNKSRLVGCGNF